MTDQLAADGVDEESHGDVDVAPDHDADTADDGSHADDDPARAARRKRVNRWDRPPEPRDWRFYVGGLGKILIATGLLVFGFVAYQLWGTGIETARAQNQLENEFETLLEQFADPEVDSSDVVASDVGDPDDGETASTQPANDPAVRPDADDTADSSAETDTTPDPEPTPAEVIPAEVIPVAVDLSDEAVVQDPIPQPFRGDPLLRLEIPEIGRDDIVGPGVALEDLKDGPGHYPDTPLPGQLGNAAIAGHRTTYGAPFYDVDRLSPGDEIITTLLNGDRFVYEVTSVEVVEATDYWVVATADPNIAELTLTSCHPKYTARDRIVVHSVLNPAKSSNVGVPTFYTLEAPVDDAPIPGDDPVLTAPPVEQTDVAGTADDADDAAPDAIADADPTDGSSAAGSVSADTDIEPGTEAEATEATGELVAVPAETPTPVDAFEQGWFHDRSAFPQIALWALALAAIAVAAYQIAKRFRRVWVGVLVGTLPFLVALYFFYQNVNRLLPAGI